MNELLKHLKMHKCYHHNIVFQYLTFYLRLKDKHSFLSKQLKDVAKHNENCFYSEKMKQMHTNNLNVTTFNMNYLLNTSYHRQEMLRNIISMFSVITIKTDWSSGYFGILYCLRSVHECDENYTMFQLRCDMRDKLNDKLFMKKLKASLNNLSNVDDNICKKDSLKDALIAFKKNIYVKGMEKRYYLTKEHKFDDKLGLTVLSLMYPTISFYCYSPLDFDLFIYKYDPNKQQTEIIRTHIYEKSSTGKNIFLMKHPTKQKKVGLFQCLMPKTEEVVS